MKCLLILCLGLTLAAPPASAKARPDRTKPQSHETAFKSLDKDGNSLLSLEEFSSGAADPAQAATEFAKLDTDKDGTLTLEEFSARADPKAREPKKKRKNEPGAA